MDKNIQSGRLADGSLTTEYTKNDFIDNERKAKMANQGQGNANATQAKSKTGSGNGIQLSYSKKIQTNGNLYTIEVMIVAKDKNGKIVNNTPVMYNDESLNIYEPTLQEKGKGRIFNFITKGSPGDKVKITVMTEIDGKAVEKDLEINLPKTPNVKATKITLGSSEPWFTEKDGKIHIMYFATVTDGSSVVEGAEVEFFGDAKTYTQEVLDNGYNNFTDKNGKAHYEYIREAHTAFGKTKTMRVKIAGTDKEDKKTIKIFPDPGTGATQRKNSQNINRHLKKSEFTKHLLTTGTIFLPAVFALMFLPNFIPAVIGLIAGYIIGGYMDGNKRRLYMSAGLATIMFLTAHLHTSVIMLSATIIMLSEFAFWYEGTNYLLKYESSGVAKTVKWEQWINFYPWVPIMLLLIVLVIDLLMLGANFFSGVWHYFSISNGTEVFREGVFYSFDTFERGPDVNILQWFWSNLFTINWQIKIIGITTLSIVSLFFRGAWGEIKDAIKSKKGELTFTNLLEKFLTIKELSDIFRNLRRAS